MADTPWALVVGASRGLGLGLAAELKRRGWNVVATARDAAGERRLRELMAQPGGVLRVEQVDINDDTAVAALRRRLDGLLFGVVFVNAGNRAARAGRHGARQPRRGGGGVHDQRGRAGAVRAGVSRPCA